VPREVPGADEILGVIRAAGGVASLAHPAHLSCQSSLELETLIRRLAAMGLIALEVIHPDHAPRQRERFIEIARRAGLATTGGSDFHRLVPGEKRGIGFGGINAPYAWLELLRSRRP